jgi:hypothetical protein
LSSLRKEFLELLRTDEEFRYVVAGLLGLGEILKRLDMHGAVLAKYGEELVKLREDMNEGFVRHDEELNKLREDMMRGFELVEKRLSSVERDVHQIRSYIERTSLTLEEEAFEVIGGKLARMGVKIALDRLILPDLEINIYGAADEICVVGEATTRAGTRIVVELDEKAKELLEKHPKLTRPKMIKTLYTMWITEEAIEEAKKRGIWVLKTTKELTPLPLSDIGCEL